MGVWGIACFFVGYTLCYAAIANHGRFAMEPWRGLTMDAYDA